MTTVVEHATPDRDERALADLGEQVAAAREALREYVAANPDARWTPRELQAQIQDGRSTSVVSIAFWELVSGGELTVDEQMQVTSAARA